MYWQRGIESREAVTAGSSFEILAHIEDLTTEILFRTLGGTPRDERVASEARRLATEAERLLARCPGADRTPLIRRARRLEGLYGDLAAASPGAW